MSKLSLASLLGVGAIALPRQQDWDGVGAVKRFNVVCRDPHILKANRIFGNEMKVGSLTTYEPRSAEMLSIQLNHAARYKGSFDLLVIDDPDKDVNLYKIDEDNIVLDLGKVSGRPIVASDLKGPLKDGQVGDFISRFKGDKLTLLWKDQKTGKYILKARFVLDTSNVGDTVGQNGNFIPPPP